MPSLELLGEITKCRTEIAPLVQSFRESLGKSANSRPLAYHAARTHAVLDSLERIVDKYRQTEHRTTCPVLNNKDYTKAEHAIDMIRNAGFKIRQSNETFGKHRTDFATPVYEKGQKWLLEKSCGTTHADALLWQFANRHTPRHSAPYFEHRGKMGASRQLWPPTKRTMKETRGWLNPGWSLTSTPWNQEIDFDDGKMSVTALAAENRQRALKSLGDSDDLSQWDKELVGAAIERSFNGGEFGMSRLQRSVTQLIKSLPSLRSIRQAAMGFHSPQSVDPETFVLTGGDSDDERSGDEGEASQGRGMGPANPAYMDPSLSNIEQRFACGYRGPGQGDFTHETLEREYQQDGRYPGAVWHETQQSRA